MIYTDIQQANAELEAIDKLKLKGGVLGLDFESGLLKTSEQGLALLVATPKEDWDKFILDTFKDLTNFKNKFNAKIGNFIAAVYINTSNTRVDHAIKIYRTNNILIMRIGTCINVLLVGKEGLIKYYSDVDLSGYTQAINIPALLFSGLVKHVKGISDTGEGIEVLFTDTSVKKYLYSQFK